MKKIKVALLLNSYTQPTWIKEMIDKLQESEACYIQYVYLPKKNNKQKNIFAKLKDNFSSIFFKAYELIDKNLLWNTKSNPFTKVYLDNLQAIPYREIDIEKKKVSEYVKPSDVEFIKKQETDVIIRLGLGIIKGQILNAATYGVWSYHHGDNRINRGRPPGIWELINQEPTTGITLQILSDSIDGGTVLFKGHSKTYPFSLFLNKCNYYWKGVFVIPREIERLKKIGHNAYFNSKKNLNSSVNIYDRPLYKNPGNVKMLGFLWRLFIKIISGYFNKYLWENTWKIGFTKETGGIDLRKSKYLTPPKNTLWADPFLFSFKDKKYLFFETKYKSHPGFIQCCEFSEKDGCSEPFPVLKLENHLSFPFLFEIDGAIYMTFENFQSEKLDLYKAKDFPYHWEYYLTLLNGKFADPVILWHEGYYWLFANYTEHNNASMHDELYLFYSENLFTTKFYKHPLNPIASSPRYSRNAGNIIKNNDEMLRFSQDIEHTYGKRVNVNKIVGLSTNEYEEVTIDKIETAWDKKFKGIHTFQKLNDDVVFDVRFWRSKFSMNY